MSDRKTITVVRKHTMTVRCTIHGDPLLIRAVHDYWDHKSRIDLVVDVLPCPKCTKLEETP